MDNRKEGKEEEQGRDMNRKERKKRVDKNGKGSKEI